MSTNAYSKSVKLELQKLIRARGTAALVFGAEQERSELNLENDAPAALKALEEADLKLNSFIETYL